MEITISWEEWHDLLKGNYTLLPCPECSQGTVYWDGSTGNVVSESEYIKLVENGEPAEYEGCIDCIGVGKIVKFDN